jgi:uncharacterized membrane protein
MVLGTPATWLIAEVLVSILFIYCIVHASKQEHGILKILELCGFIFYSAIFENIGVYTQIYDYNLNRIMLIGKVPIEVLMVEGIIFYASLQLVNKLHIPSWGKPFAVGFLSSFQDMSLDPSAVFDLHKLDGVMSGQWNWTFRYDGTFFGIPFFNFSGWMYLMAYYVLAIQVGMWLYKKYKKEWIGYVYPFVGGLAAAILLVSPITQFLLFVNPFFPMYTRGAEMAILAVNYLVGLGILLRFMKVDQPFELKSPIFIIPLVLHLFDLAIAFALQLQIAYVPVVTVSLLHMAFLAFVYARGKALRNTAAVRAAA